MAKHRRRLSWEHVEKLIALLIGAIEPVAKLITAISRLRLQTWPPARVLASTYRQGAISTFPDYPYRCACAQQVGTWPTMAHLSDL
jgi:hypothetical protein